MLTIKPRFDIGREVYLFDDKYTNIYPNKCVVTKVNIEITKLDIIINYKVRDVVEDKVLEDINETRLYATRKDVAYKWIESQGLYVDSEFGIQEKKY